MKRLLSASEKAQNVGIGGAELGEKDSHKKSNLLPAA